jgi:hypothetical protein
MNSYDNLFVLFCAIGERCFDAAVVGGDDGICMVHSEDVDAILNAATKCGFSLKMKVRKPGEPFTLLGRYFSWGSSTTMCDPLRIVPKLHVVSHAGLPEKYWNARYLLKLSSLRESDANTPLIGDFLAKEFARVLALPGSNAQLPRAIIEDDWRKRIGWESGNWPNQFAPWMVEVVDQLVAFDGHKFVLK